MTLCVVRLGDIKIKMFDGCEEVLWDVRHVLGLRRSLISLETVRNDVLIYMVDEDKETMKVMQGQVTVTEGKMIVGHLYKLEGNIVASGILGQLGVALFTCPVSYMLDLGML